MTGCVFAIPVIEKWLVYAPLHAVTALVNHTALAKLKEGHLPNESKMIGQLKSVMASKPENVPRPRKGDLCPEFLGLVATRACNLSCLYCAFGADLLRTDTMDLRRLVLSIDWYAEHMRRIGGKVLEVHLFGGEPTVAWDVLVVAVHRARAVAAEFGMRSSFEMSTNGVFDERCARFVGDYFDSVVLSLDGTQEIHDHQRPMNRSKGSFEVVARTAETLSKYPVDLCIRSCVTQESVSRLEELASLFCQRFRPSTVNFEPLQATSEALAAGLRPPDPYEFAVQFDRARQLLLASGVRAVYGADLTETPQLTFCPVGKDALIVSPDGQISACYLPKTEWETRGLDLVCGQVDETGGVRIDTESIVRIRNLVSEKPRCEHCFCRWSCAGGCHVKHSHPGCDQSYDDFCISTRIITACSLLRQMDCETLVHVLLNDQSSMEALALHQSDCLESWGS